MIARAEPSQYWTRPHPSEVDGLPEIDEERGSMATGDPTRRGFRCQIECQKRGSEGN
jgi:hypothetical protein